MLLENFYSSKPVTKKIAESGEPLNNESKKMYFTDPFLI